MGWVSNQAKNLKNTSQCNEKRHPESDFRVLFCLVFDRLDICIRQAKMMANLVNQHMGDNITQSFLMFGPVIQNGAAEQGDPVWRVACLQAESLADALPLEQPHQVERRIKAHVLDDLIIGKIGNLDDEIAAKRTKFLRLARKGFDRD